MNPAVRTACILLAAAGLLVVIVLIAGMQGPVPIAPLLPGPGTPGVTPGPSLTGPSPVTTVPLVTTEPTPSGPPGFTLFVTPVEVRARPGEVVTYTLTIEPRGGFAAPVALRLDASALFLFRNSYDLGVVVPPYPRTVQYPFVVPSELPAGITVRGVLSGDGGGHREERDLVLIVR
jgi:hypothetical protein